MNKKLAIIVAVCFCAGLLFPFCSAGQTVEDTFVTIGSGDVAGVYFPTGLAMAGLLNKKRQDYGLRVTVESTPGSTFNLNAILAGYMEFGLTQADKEYHAVKGLAEWAGKGPQDRLRTLFSIYDETVTLVAADDAGIQSIEDLKGKRVSIGNPGSSQHQLVTDILVTFGIDPERDMLATTVYASDAPALLQDHHIDAYFFIVGHPSETIRLGLTNERKARIISIAGPPVEKLLAEKQYYAKARIEVRKLYPGAASPVQEIETVGVKALLCSSVEVPEQAVYALTREVFENLEQFRSQHPALAGLSQDEMLTGISAPLHPGALKYFKEAGLVR